MVVNKIKEPIIIPVIELGQKMVLGYLLYLNTWFEKLQSMGPFVKKYIALIFL